MKTGIESCSLGHLRCSRVEMVKATARPDKSGVKNPIKPQIMGQTPEPARFSSQNGPNRATNMGIKAGRIFYRIWNRLGLGVTKCNNFPFRADLGAFPIDSPK